MRLGMSILGFFYQCVAGMPQRPAALQTAGGKSRMQISMLFGLITTIGVAQAPALRIAFTPETPQFEAASSEYAELWAREGERVVNAMESVSGLKFDRNEVTAIVFEGTSESGYRERP